MAKWGKTINIINTKDVPTCLAHPYRANYMHTRHFPQPTTNALIGAHPTDYIDIPGGVTTWRMTPWADGRWSVFDFDPEMLPQNLLGELGSLRCQKHVFRRGCVGVDRSWLPPTLRKSRFCHPREPSHPVSLRQQLSVNPRELPD